MLRRTALFLPLLVTAARAHSYRAGDIKIGHAWALPTLAGQDGQAFMPLLNSGTETEVLVEARSDSCLFIQIRRTARYDDPSEKQLELLANMPVPMRPHALHLRLVGMRHELKLGQRFPLILDFLNAGEVKLDVDIQNKPGD